MERVGNNVFSGNLKRKCAKILSLAVSCAGLAVMAGWALDITALKSVSAGYVTMKFVTALGFFLSGVILFLITLSMGGRKEAARVALPAAVLAVLILMTTLVTSSLLGIESGMEELFIREWAGVVRTVVPGRPSIITAVDFILIAACGMAAMFEPDWLKQWLFYNGLAVAGTGVVAVAGYVFDMPILYYSFASFTAMALHTASLFCVCGAVLILLSRMSLDGESHEH